MVEVVTINVGTPKVLVDGPERVYSAIAKQPVALGTTLWLSTGNLAGDAQADLSVHGGADKAVYAYPSEHLTAWTAELGEPLGPAAFGENLSTRGVVEADVCIGDVWKWDDALLQVSQPRWPCFKLALHRGRRDIQQQMRRVGPDRLVSARAATRRGGRGIGDRGRTPRSRGTRGRRRPPRDGRPPPRRLRPHRGARRPRSAGQGVAHPAAGAPRADRTHPLRPSRSAATSTNAAGTAPTTRSSPRDCEHPTRARRGERTG